jgi:hypothetical protein
LDLLTRYSIMNYEILDGLSGLFRDWIIVAYATRYVYRYVPVSDLWTIQVLEIVEMNSCVVWLMCYVNHTKVHSELWDLLLRHAVLCWFKTHLLGNDAELVGENTWQLFSNYDPFTSTTRRHAPEDLNLGIVCCYTAVILSLLRIKLFKLNVRQIDEMYRNDAACSWNTCAMVVMV